MANIFIKNDEKTVTVKITINTGGLWEYDYEHHNGTHYPGINTPMPTAPFPHEYVVGNENIGKSDFWTLRIINEQDREIDYILHIEWWQDQKLTDEWDKEGSVKKDEPVKVIVGEGKFKKANN